jgi:hypothetical protein
MVNLIFVAHKFLLGYTSASLIPIEMTPKYQQMSAVGADHRFCNTIDEWLHFDERGSARRNLT